MAGSLKRQNPDTHEDVVLVRALRDSNLPKFRQQGALLFQVSPLFPFGLLAFLWPLLSQMIILRWEIFPGTACHTSQPNMVCFHFMDFIVPNENFPQESLGGFPEGKPAAVGYTSQPN